MSVSSSATVVLSSPRFVWNIYVEYLWNYESNSWVASTANTFRVLSLLMFAPVFILTLLDVISYVIARTLGVIDDTKASTSEIQNDTLSTRVSSTAIDAPPKIHVQQDDGADDVDDGDATPMSTPPPTYFHSTMESAGNLKLSGVDMFSPAPSQPPSPTMSRKDLAVHMMHQVRPMSKIVSGSEEKEKGDSGSVTPGSEVSSFSVGSSFAFPGDSGSEDGLQVRKRRPGGEGDA